MTLDVLSNTLCQRQIDTSTTLLHACLLESKFLCIQWELLPGTTAVS